MCREETVIKLDVTETYDEDEKHTETAEFTSTTWSEKEWLKKLAAIDKEGIRKATEMRSLGHEFLVRILVPEEGVERSPCTLTAVKLKIDGRLAHRLEMCDVAVALLTKFNQINELDHILPNLLADAINGRGTYKGSFGEFFELYGIFIGKYSLESQRTIRNKMLELIGEHSGCTKVYIERGRKRDEPLPLAVRNTIAHPEDKSNSLDPERKDLKKAIELLRSWLGKP